MTSDDADHFDHDANDYDHNVNDYDHDINHQDQYADDIVRPMGDYQGISAPFYQHNQYHHHWLDIWHPIYHHYWHNIWHPNHHHDLYHIH